MAFVNCLECSAEISDQAAACVKCGAPIGRAPWVKPDSAIPTYSRSEPPPLAAHQARPARLWPWVLAAAAVLFLLIGEIHGNDPAYQARAQDKAAIDYCWQEQSRKSLDPGSARFVASACEKLEADFLTKHGRKP